MSRLSVKRNFTGIKAYWAARHYCYELYNNNNNISLWWLKKNLYYAKNFSLIFFTLLIELFTSSFFPWYTDIWKCSFWRKMFVTNFLHQIVLVSSSARSPIFFFIYILFLTVLPFPVTELNVSFYTIQNYVRVVGSFWYDIFALDKKLCSYRYIVYTYIRFSKVHSHKTLVCVCVFLTIKKTWFVCVSMCVCGVCVC